MNEIINKFSLAWDKFTPELHLRQPGFTNSAHAPFNNYREKIQKFRDTGNLKWIYKNDLDDFCFAHDTTYVKSQQKELFQMIFLKAELMKLLESLNIMDIKEDWEVCCMNFFDKKRKKQDQEQKQTYVLARCQLKNYANQRLKNSKEEKSMLGLKIMFGSRFG